LKKVIIYQRNFSCGLTDKYAFVAGRLPPKASVLEIGCSSGYFTKALADRGYDVVGIEYDSEAANAARQLGLKIIYGDIEQPATFRSISDRFDAVLLMDVLEHLRDPKGLLRRLLGLLKPSGRLLCTGPNVAYWAMRKDLLLGRWNYQDTGIMDRTHLHFYNAKTWQELLERAGYTVEKFQSVEGMIPLEGRLQRMSGLRPLIAGLRNLAIGYAPSLFTTVYFMEARPTNSHSSSVGGE
jgi:SAM-dependent methyltransferase